MSLELKGMGRNKGKVKDFVEEFGEKEKPKYRKPSYQPKIKTPPKEKKKLSPETKQKIKKTIKKSLTTIAVIGGLTLGYNAIKRPTYSHQHFKQFDKVNADMVTLDEETEDYKVSALLSEDIFKMEIFFANPEAEYGNRFENTISWYGLGTDKTLYGKFDYIEVRDYGVEEHYDTLYKTEFYKIFGKILIVEWNNYNLTSRDARKLRKQMFKLTDEIIKEYNLEDKVKESIDEKNAELNKTLEKSQNEYKKGLERAKIK